jgi:TRAP transporter TAXI family solute receptor
MKQRKHFVTRTKAYLLLFIFLSTFSLVSYAPALAQEAKLAFASGSVGAIWYYGVGGFLQVIGKQLKGFQVSVTATGGSVENIRQLAKKDTDFGWAQSPNMYDAWNGVGLFKGKQTQDFRMLSLVYDSEHTIICLDDGKIRTLADLKGKRVQMGPPGSGTAINTENIFKALNLFKDIKPVYMAAADAVDALADRKIDAVGQSSGPAANITSIAAVNKIYMIPLSEEELNKVLKEYPYYTAGKVQPNMYPGNVPPKPINSIFFQTYWVAHKDVEDRYVYEILKAGFAKENREPLINVHRFFKEMSPSLDKMAGLKIPLHPGAEKFWKEQGLTIPQAISAKR